MRQTISAMALALGLALPLPAMQAAAQEAPADAGGQTAPAPANENGANENGTGENEASENGAADPAAPEMRIKLRETFGDWEVRCAPDESECFMYQLATDANDNPVAEINLVRLAEGSPAVAGATVLTPLGTLLRPGLAVQVDEEQQRSYPFAWCDAAGCFARFALDQEAVDTYKQGNAARMTLFSIGAPGTPVELSISLNGFTAAMDSLDPIPN